MMDVDDAVIEQKITVILMGDFHSAWLQFLQWKNTYPVSSNVSFLHIGCSERQSDFIAKNYQLNPSDVDVDISIAESIVTFIVVAEKSNIQFSQLFRIAAQASNLSFISMIYIANAQYSLMEIDQLNTLVDSVIISDQEQHWPELFFQSLQQQIHRNNDLIFIACIEALINSIFRPDLALICMDIIHIKDVISLHRRAYIGSSVVDVNGSGSALAKKTLGCSMLLGNIFNAAGIYFLITYGEGRGTLAEFQEICDFIEQQINEEAIVIVGMRYSKYLQKDEMQLTVIATKDYQEAR